MLLVYLVLGFLLLVRLLQALSGAFARLLRRGDCTSCGHHVHLHDPSSGCIAAAVRGLDKPCGCVR